MGYCVTAFAVGLGKINEAIGSRNKPLLNLLIEEFEEDFDQYDQMAANYVEDEDPDSALTMRGALTQMVMGDAYNERLGFMYGYALEFLCRHFGEFLPNRQWSAMPSGCDWADTVDRGLDRAGVPKNILRVSWHLINRGPPIAIPEIDDFPGIGYVKRSEVEAARMSLANARLDAIQNDEVLSSVQELQGWLQKCSDSGVDLLCFLA